ncbi:MAG TPA: hypothetical protein VGC36_09440 [Rhizomicrobium sp.]
MSESTASKRTAAIVAAAILLSAAGGLSSAAEFDQPAVSPSPSTPSYSVITYGTRNPNCRQWTDRCVVCTMFGCSNIAIACQPQDVVCTDPPAEPDK